MYRLPLQHLEQHIMNMQKFRIAKIIYVY